MATLPWASAENDYSSGGFGLGYLNSFNKVVLTSAADTSEWLRVDGPVNITCYGGTTFIVEVYRAMESDQSDPVLVDTQIETDRTGRYDFLGPGWVKVTLSAVSGTPVTVRMSK